MAVDARTAATEPQVMPRTSERAGRLTPMDMNPASTDPAGSPMARALFAYLVLGVAVGKAFDKYSTEIPFGGSAWSAGEWLVNYGGGFVRRGLFGELFLAVAPGGQTGLWLLFAIQMALYGLVLVWVVQVLHRTRYSWSAIALVCGPAGLAFAGWGDSSLHKEVLPFAVLVLLGWARSRRRSPAGSVALVVVAGALFVLAVFSWEASALFLPAVGYLLLGRGAPHPELVVFRWSAAVVFGVVGGIGAIVSTLVHGDLATAAAVCETVRAHGFIGPDVCGSVTVSGGGIEAIGWTSYKTTQDLLTAFPVYIGYIPLVLLALVPVVVSRWFRRNWGWAALVVLGILPLYAVVTDYGRWTHAIVIALTICLTADDPDAVHSRWWNWIGGVAYVSLWALPHWVHPQTDAWPWYGFAQNVIDYGIEFLGFLMTALR